MRLLNLRGCIARNRGDDAMTVALYADWGSMQFATPERVIDVSFGDKLITSSKGYGFSFLAGQLVITDDETDVIMPPFGPPYIAEMIYSESRAVFGLADSHEGWITGKGVKRPADSAAFDLKTIKRMFP